MECGWIIQKEHFDKKEKNKICILGNWSLEI